MIRFFDLRWKKGIKLMPLYLNESLRAVAISLLDLFSAIFVYKIVYSLTTVQKTALLGAVGYYLGLYVFKFIGNLLAEDLALRLGLKKAIYLGEAFLIICLLSLSFASLKPGLLMMAAATMGLSAGFYWFGRHGLMAKEGQTGDFGEQLGWGEVVRTTLLLGTPLAGGLVVSWFGYRALFLVSLVFVILSALTIFEIKEEKTHRDTNLKEILSLFRHLPKTFLAYLGNSAARTIYTVVFTLWLFLILKKEVSLGSFFSLAMTLTALINLLVGRWIDLRGKKGPLQLGSVTSFLVWFGRFVSRFPPGLLIFDVIDRFTAGMTGIPLSVLSYEKALAGHSTGRAILFRELAITLGSILACFLVLGLIWLGIGLEFAFLLAAIFSFLPILIVEKS